MAEELVEQARLAGVGPADDRGANAAAEDLALVGGAQQFVHEGHAVFEPGEELVAGVGRDVFLGEINVRFDVGQGFEHFVAQLVDALGELAGELFVGGAQGQLGARVDQIGHGFGLGQVNAPVEEGAAGEFAGLGQARAVGQHGVQHQLRRQDPAVAGDFDHILARERARRAHDGQQGFIHVLSVAHDVAEVNRVRGRGGRLGRGLAGGREAAVGDRQRLRAGNADHGQPAFAERGGDRSYGVVLHGEEVKGSGSRVARGLKRLTSPFQTPE